MEKRKRVILTITKKLEIIQKLESGVSASRICEEYGIKKQTVSNIKTTKDKIKKFALTHMGTKANARKSMRRARETLVEEALLKWYAQQRACGISVRAVELKSAAIKLASHMNTSFKASNGWLWRFCKRHDVTSKSTCGETSQAAPEEIGPFKQKLMERINNEELSRFQIYNADETSLHWRSVPENVQAFKFEKSTVEKKIKERISTLFCANADGSHRLPLVIVNKSHNSRVLRNAVLCYNSKTGSFTSDIFQDWFFKKFVPAVRKFQVEKFEIPQEDVKCLLLLVGTPVHPYENTLCSKDGKFRCMLMPKHISLIHPMNQGIILETKRIYRKKFLEEIIVISTDEDNEEDTRGARTLQNLKSYRLKSAVFNLVAAWKGVKVQTLKNVWKQLLEEKRTSLDLRGLEVADYCKLIQSVGEKIVEQDVLQWLEDGDPLYYVITKSEMIDEGDSGTSDVEETTVDKTNLLAIKSHLDDLIEFIDNSSDTKIQLYYTHFSKFRELIIKKQQTSQIETSLDGFFKIGSSNIRASISNINDTPEGDNDAASFDAE